MKSRTRARSVALQILYEIDLVGHVPRIALENRLEEESQLEEKLIKFVEELVMGISPMVNVLDEYLAEYAPEWPFEQVAVVDRNILRIALWEFAVDGSTPVKVAINEAIELAKMFGSDSAARFVNGVLGSLADHYEDIIQSLRKVRET